MNERLEREVTNAGKEDDKKRSKKNSSEDHKKEH
jgi:hypothetical protein